MLGRMDLGARQFFHFLSDADGRAVVSCGDRSLVIDILPVPPLR